MRHLLTSLVLLAAARTPRQDASAGADWPILTTDLQRIEELEHISDVLGDSLWPKFDIRLLPIAINVDDQHEILIRHPAPPHGYQPLPQLRFEGEVLVGRDGATVHVRKGTGTVVQVGPVWTVYLSTIRAGQSTDEYLAQAVHEAFHGFQLSHGLPAGSTGELPEFDSGYASLSALESHLLKSALEASDHERIARLVRMFIAVRHEKQRLLGDALANQETAEETGEGLAQYVQTRLCELLAADGGIEPVSPCADPNYHGFVDAGAMLEQELTKIIPDGTYPANVHSKYYNGLAQWRLLDSIRPAWKGEIMEQPRTAFSLLQAEFPLVDGDEAALLANAREEFGFGQIKEQQEAWIAARINKTREYLVGAGRRYRIFLDEVSGPFEWKPEGPVHHVPKSLEEEIDKGSTLAVAAEGSRIVGGERMVWEGGIRYLRKGDLVFESACVPIIWSRDCIEWIDRTPTDDFDDFKVNADRSENQTYWNLRLETRGFVLRVPRATIHRSRDVVEIRPLLERGGGR